MKQQTSISRLSSILAYFMITVLMALSVNAYANPEPVNLGEAGKFAVMSKVSISDTVPTATVITGDIGISPNGGTSITGIACSEFVGTMHVASAGGDNIGCQTVDPAYLTPTILEMEAAYTDALSRASDATMDTDLGGETLTPGVYTTAVDLGITSDLNLNCGGDANGVFIFRVAGKLDLSASTDILLSGSCRSENIFWAVAGTTTINGGVGTESTFEGTVLGGPATSEIAVITGSTINGRLLGQKGIALDQNIITKPAVSSLLINLVRPATNTWNTNDTPAFTFNYTGASTANCTLVVDGADSGTSLVLNNTNTAITANASLSQGNHSWYIHCVDQSNNVSNSGTRKILVDSIAPVATINSINTRTSSGLATTNTSLAANFTVNDTNIMNWTLSVQNSSGELLQNWTGYTNNVSAALSYVAGLNGTYFFNLSAIDNASTRTTTFFNITVDQSNPVITSVSTSSITTSGATLTVNANDTYSGISTCTYSGAGSGSLSLGSGVYTASLSGLSASTAYTVTVNCNDKADNSAASTTSFTTSAVTSSGGSGGGGGGGSSSSNWRCSEWSACGSDGTQIKTCTTSNGGTSSQTQSCTPTRTTTTTPKAVNTTQPTPQTTTSGSTGSTGGTSTGTAGQDTTGSAPTDGNLITGQAIGGQKWYKTSWWVTALVMIAIAGLITGIYFMFRK